MTNPKSEMNEFLDDLIVIISDLLSATRELNGEYQSGWDTTISNAEEMLGYLKLQKTVNLIKPQTNE